MGSAALKHRQLRIAEVVVFGFNHPRWHISALAAIVAGGKAAGIYPTDTKDQVRAANPLTSDASTV